MQKTRKVEILVNPPAMRKLFTGAGCPGIAKLIGSIQRHGTQKVSSMSIPDPDDLIHGVTDAVMKGFGVTESFATHAQTMKALFGATDLAGSARKRKPEHVSGLEIGPFTAADGSRIEATQLQWLAMLGRVKDQIAPAALKKVDEFCAAVVHAERTAVPLDTSEL